MLCIFSLVKATTVCCLCALDFGVESSGFRKTRVFLEEAQHTGFGFLGFGALIGFLRFLFE